MFSAQRQTQQHRPSVQAMLSSLLCKGAVSGLLGLLCCQALHPGPRPPLSRVLLQSRLLLLQRAGTAGMGPCYGAAGAACTRALLQELKRCQTT